MGIFVDVVLVSITYVIGYRIGMKHASSIWNEALDEVEDEVKKRLQEDKSNVKK